MRGINFFKKLFHQWKAKKLKFIVELGLSWKFLLCQSVAQFQENVDEKWDQISSKIIQKLQINNFFAHWRDLNISFMVVKGRCRAFIWPKKIIKRLKTENASSFLIKHCWKMIFYLFIFSVIYGLLRSFFSFIIVSISLFISLLSVIWFSRRGVGLIH